VGHARKVSQASDTGSIPVARSTNLFPINHFPFSTIASPQCLHARRAVACRSAHPTTESRPLPPSRQPTRGERIWSLRKDVHRVDRELRFHRESYGWECQCLYDGELVHGRRFGRQEDALEEAEAHRERLLADGWLAHFALAARVL